MVEPAQAASHSAERASGFKATWLDALTLMLIAGLGLLHLHAAFSGDQFLYMVGAKKLAHGGVMYRDFWDLKQPLIYYIYELAGRVFGFTEAGIHVFETIYQTLFAAVLIRVCANRFAYRWLASLVPLFTIGAYYGFANYLVLSSVEAFAGFPIFASAVLAAGAVEGKPGADGRAFAAGVSAAVVAALKLAYLPIVVMMWLVPLFMSLNGRHRVRVQRFLLLGALGFVIPIALAVLAFAAAGALETALRTTFIDPPEIVRHLTAADRGPFKSEAVAFIRAMWPLFVLALAGAVWARPRTDAFKLQMLFWTIAGCALIAAQEWSFYYKFFIVVVPVGVLAALGLEHLLSTVNMRRDWTRAVLAVALAAMLASVGTTAVHMQRRWALWDRENRAYAASSIAFLGRPGARQGPIYVFGHPRIYYFSGREQAVAINGFSPQLLLGAQWRALRDELAAVAPVYIFVERDGYVPVAPLVRASPQLTALLASSYRVAAASSDGTWYEHR